MTILSSANVRYWPKADIVRYFVADGFVGHVLVTRDKVVDRELCLILVTGDERV